MPIKGVGAVRANYSRVINEVSGPKTVKVVSAIVSIGAGYAKLYTPLMDGALINSQRKSVSQSGGAIVGRVWYSQDYAVWLETKDTWKPVKKKTAKPHFLRSGFEDEGPQSEIKEIIRNGYKL